MNIEKEEFMNAIKLSNIIKLCLLEDLSTEEEKQDAAQELYYWQNSNATPWFRARLYSLFSVADLSNQDKLGKGFPAEYYVFLEWQSMSEEEFFNKYNINLNK